jgi:ribosomal protein L37E
MKDAPLTMSEEEFHTILGALTAKGVSYPCQRCGNTAFELQPSYCPLPMAPDQGMHTTQGAFIPTAVVACRQCGNLTFHSLAQLGIKK